MNDPLTLALNKLRFLQCELLKASDPTQVFSIKNHIRSTKEIIAELEGSANDSLSEHADQRDNLATILEMVQSHQTLAEATEKARSKSITWKRRFCGLLFLGLVASVAATYLCTREMQSHQPRTRSLAFGSGNLSGSALATHFSDQGFTSSDQSYKYKSDDGKPKSRLSPTKFTQVCYLSNKELAHK